ncbi:MAG: hypothetical protein KKF30_07430 [Proteobacteria bacterium]|nr:hypothetical protein [Pseudomonadota bacterium]MBU4470301.1 hypothetical protein [Pseudomonadota bacterium]MCG2752713.1 hypothetical protein [Desulfobacteraceae bacterium]
MSLTITNLERSLLTNKRIHFADLAFDNAYAAGGESLSPALLALSSIDSLSVNPIKGFSFEYDQANKKLKAFLAAPPIVVEEAHTITAGAITLDYPAAAILQIATATQSQMLIEPSDTLAASECQLSAAMAAGVRPAIKFHADTTGAVKITYITQAWKEVWDNRVAAADFVTAAHVADIGDTVCFIESCCAKITTGAVVNSLNKFIRAGDAADAGECEVDFSDAAAVTAGDTTLTFNATDAVTAIKLTYIKLPASGFLKQRFLEDEDLTMTSGVGASKYPILFPALCNQIPDFTAAAERAPHHLMMPEGDALGTAQEIRIDWHLTKTLMGTQITANDATSDAISLSYVYGFPGEIGVIPLEVKNAEDLSGLTGIKIQAIGV